MKILFLAPRLPWPIDTGGKIRTFQILKQLAKKAEITLVCFSFAINDEHYLETFKNLNIEVLLVPFAPPSFLQKIRNLFFNNHPYSMLKYKSSIMQRTLVNLLKKQAFDIIHIDHLHMAHYRPCFLKKPCFLDEHNVEYKILQRCIPVEKNIFKKLIFQSQTLKLKKFEENLTKKFTGCLVVSENDKSLLADLTNNEFPIHIIPNGVDTTFFNPDVDNQSIAKDHAIVFTGSMDWLPNHDAAIFFCAKILPLIWQKNKDVTFYVIGKNPLPELKKLAEKDPRIILTGRVDDVRAYINKGKIFVVPLRVGGGTRLKILEAMSMKKTVVSTKIGAEGIAYHHEQNIILADQPQHFAETIVKLMNTPDQIKKIGDEARKLVCQTYDWEIVGRRLLEIYEKFI